MESEGGAMSTVPTGGTCRVEFRFQFKSSELSVVDLPVEVRGARLNLVSRNPASRGADLPAGSYFVTARLPSGQEFSRSVVVTTPGSPKPTGWEGGDVFEWRGGRHPDRRAIAGPRRGVSP